MRIVELSLLTALCTSPIITLSMSTPAYAQESVFAGGIEDLLPGEPAVADGNTQVTYFFLLLNSDGTAIDGITGKTSIGSAKGTLKSEGNGVYSTTLIPEKISSATNDFIQINARTAQRRSIRKSFPIRLVPTPSAEITMTASPEEITLGQDDFVTIKVQVPSEFAQDKLMLNVSTGTVEDLVSLGNGQFSARYIPPTKKTYPHIAVFTLSDLTNPELKSHLVLKQKGKANFAVNTNPNSNVIIRIDDRDFGPVQTDASGKAAVPIVAPPGQPEAKLIVITNEQRKEELLDLRIPKNVPRLNILPTFQDIPADGFTKHTLYAYVATAKGEPDTRATMTCKATLGECGPVEPLGDGYYSMEYTSPLKNEKATERIQLMLEDPSGDIVDSESFTLLPVLPGEVALRAAETVLPKNIPAFGLTIQVKDNENHGLEDRNLIIMANGAKMNKSPVSLGSGDYTVKLTPISDNPIEVTTAVKGSASNNPPFGIAMRPNYDRLPNDGISSSLLSFMVYDRFGQPVANQPLSFEIEGDGQLPNQSKSNGAGLAQVTYTAGTRSGLVRITATSGELQSEFVLFVAPKESLDSLPELKRSQNQFHQRLQDRLFKSINHIRFEREGMEGVALTGEVDKVGEATSLSLKAEPNKVTPGGKTKINMSLTDKNGRGISGEDLTVMASSGSIGKIQDLGSGQYSVSLIAPTTSNAPITIVVQSSDANLEKELEVEVIGETTEGSVDNADANQTALSEKNDDNATQEPQKEKKQKKPKRKKERTPKERIPKEPRERTSSEIPWLRAGVGYVAGAFNYQQVPTSTTGLLYEKAITFNRQTEGSSPALTAGLDVRAMGTVPSFENIGFDVHVQSDHYSIALTEFPDPIGDWMTSIDAMAAAQYPIALSGMTVTPSFRLGLLRDDLIIFRQNIQDDGNIELSYEPLFVTAPNLGLGADLYTDTGIFAHLTYDMGLRGSVYRHKFETQVGYDVSNTLYAFVSGRSTIRNVDVETSTGKAGEIHDGNYSFVTGIGGRFQ